ncbi:alpha/beta hydrolase [Lewinella sp. IMCC34191]|uniref:alpha/beta hydrolase n=1 Tax=Lewinella sp. IMCC34191 TaxID=2259172 RepID=UPI000E22E090|nr:alpha/beta hydrolase [Lewinella sp. IMCC34191]
MQHIILPTVAPCGLPSLSRLLFCAGLTILMAASLTSCSDDDDLLLSDDELIEPMGPKPDYAPDMDDQMWAVIEQFVAFGDPALPELTARQARMNHSVTDALNTLLARNNQPAPVPEVMTDQRILPPSFTPQSAPDGIPVRVYTPTEGSSSNRPGIVYYHGGGWVIGSLEVYEPSAQLLAELTGAVVVSVDYRLASEDMNKFPAAHEDAFAAYKWVRENAASIGIDSSRIATAGESAGGNMAAAVCLMARDRGVTLPVHQLLVYPVANNDLMTESYEEYANAVPLNRPNIIFFTEKYFNSPADGDNPLISLVDEAELTGMPPATIIAAEIDPLQTEGMLLAQALRDAGVAVTYELYPGTTHEFFGTYAAVPLAGEAQQLAADELNAAFQ